MSAPHAHHALTPHTARFCPLCGAGVTRQPVPPEGKIEAVCGGCRFVFYLNQKVVAGTIPEQDGRILLTRRAIHPAHGKWTFPGGYVDYGEVVEAAAVRETFEETGMHVVLGELVGVYSYQDSPVVIVVYRASVTGGQLTTCHENDCVEWVEPDAIPWEELAFPSTRAALGDYLKSRGSGSGA